MSSFNEKSIFREDDIVWSQKIILHIGILVFLQL